MTRTAMSIIAITACFAATPALGAPFAMVTDLKGDAWTIEMGKPKKLALLGYLDNPMEITVERAARLSITYFASGVQYDFAGPARVALAVAAPKVVDGRGAESRKVTPEKSIVGGLSTEQWRRLQQATVVMRNVNPTFAVVGPDNTAVLDRDPEFEWTTASGANAYRATVYGPDNRKLLEATTEHNRLRPGAALALQAGQRYRWTVEAIGSANPLVASGAFTAADDAARERLSALRRAAGSQLAVRAFYATTLEAEGFAHDARAEWKALATDFPDEAEIVKRSR